MYKLEREFYQRSALDSVKDFLGKILVHNSFKGRIAGVITEVEAYPAYIDAVSHANKRTPRTDIIYGPGGFAYVYLIYGIHHQFSVVVNKQDVPEVVFIRGIFPMDGIDLMEQNLGKKINNTSKIADTPGKLTKAFGISKRHYGLDITGPTIFLEDRGIVVPEKSIKRYTRVGIDPELEGSEFKYRYKIDDLNLINQFKY